MQCALGLAAQSQEADSLRSVIRLETDAEKLVELYDKLDNRLPNPNDKLKYGREAYQMIDEVSDRSKIVLSTNMGVAHGMLGQMDSAEHYFKYALEASLSTGDSAYISSAYNGMGNIKRITGNLEASLDYFLKALDYADAMPRKTWKGDVLTNIGGLYYDLQDYKACLAKVQEARAIFIEAKDTLNIGYSSTLLAIAHRALHQYDEAVRYNKEALGFIRKTNDTTQIVYNLITTTSILLDQKKFDEAELTLKECLMMSQRYGERDPEITSQLTLASIYFRQGRISLAETHIDEAINVSKKYDFKNTLPKAYAFKALVLAAKGKYEEAFQMTEQGRLANDSIRSSEISARTKELQAKYESDKKEAEIQRLSAAEQVKDLNLRQARTVNVLLSALVALGAVALVIFWYSYRQRVRINAQLESVNQTKDKLLSIIAHDIKNPLSAIQGLASLLEEEHKEMDEKQRLQLISMMHTSSDKLFELLQNLLEWSITEAGGLNYQPEVVKPREIVTEALELFKGGVEVKKLRVMNEVPEGARVHADYKMLFSVLRNLLSNAVKFTPAGGKIRIGLEVSGDFAALSVTDSGPGISSDRVSSLFTRSDNKSTHGTGLGLVLCKEFVEKNKGKITVESMPSQTTFRFTVPKA